jgi:hypothetical protein
MIQSCKEKVHGLNPYFGLVSGFYPGSCDHSDIAATRLGKTLIIAMYLLVNPAALALTICKAVHESFGGSAKFDKD